MTENGAINNLELNRPFAYSELQESIDIAIDALKKQIPKKPDYEGDGYADGQLVYDYAKCPICGHDFEYGINDWECEYCSDCGQKLDWSDID